VRLQCPGLRGGTARKNTEATVIRPAPSLLPFVGALGAAGFIALAANGGRAQTGALPAIEETEVKSHPSQGDVKTVAGAKARLVRTAAGIFASLDTEGLITGHAYTLLLAVINNPAACGTNPCKPADVVGRSAETKSDIVGVADGTIVGEDGKARFASFQPVGELPEAWFGNGLQDPTGAEIHLVVHDHGPMLPELGALMLTTYRTGCAHESIPAAFPDEAKMDGEPGPNTCRLVQVATFPPHDR
jgi:hypothetical protein